MLTNQAIASKATQFARVGSLYYLISFLCSGAYMPFMFVHYAELGLSGQQIGWISSLFPLMTLLLATPVASLADRRRWRVRILRLAIAGLGATLLLLSLPTTFVWIAALMLVMAIVSSPIMSVSDSLIARIAQRHQLNYGGMRLWGSMGFAASALVFGALWQLLGFKPMFVVAPLFLAPLIWLTGQFEEIPAGPRAERKPAADLLRDMGLVILLLATFLAAISNSLSMTFGGIYARSLGGGNLLIGMMIAFAGFSEILTMFYGERIAKRLRGSNTVILSYGLMASAFLGYVFVENANALVLFSILKGLGYGLWFPVTVRMITERTPEARASTAQSFVAVSMFGLAPLVAGPLGGLIHDAVSPAAVFWLGILTLGLAAASLWFASLRGMLD